MNDTFEKNGNILLVPAVPLRGMVMFPNEPLHFDVGRKKTIAAVKTALVKKQDLLLVAQKDASVDNPTGNDIYSVGVLCSVIQAVKLPHTEVMRVYVEGKKRVRVDSIMTDKLFYSAFVEEINEKKVSRNDADLQTAFVRNAKELFADYIELNEQIPPDVIIGVEKCNTAGEIADRITYNIPLEYKDKQAVLETIDELKRIEKLCVILSKENAVLSIEEGIRQKVNEQIDENQREYYLREQLKAVSAELNDGEDVMNEAEEYKKKILAIGFEKEDEKKLLKECKRFSQMQSSSPDANVIRNYLDRVLDLPWNKYSKDNLNLENARKVLDRDHYGLDEIKDRIVEMLAVLKMSGGVKGQVICLVGPPGTGKTSIVKSLAKAMNRKYVRIALGGVHDEAEIRGHRKTYIGAMPGRIIDAVEKAGTANPLILLDEIDKLGMDYKGDPSAALLEVLDGEQNNSFTDHYIEIPFDLSKALFITTANDLSTVPEPLLDRMEVIELRSYTREEKFNIAKKHLVKKQLAANGLTSKMVTIKDDALYLLIDGYTREAGVRKLERIIGKVLRKTCIKFANGFEGKITIKASDLHEYVGAVKYKNDTTEKSNEIGVVNGLAWTSVGGEMLKIEVAVMEGTGKVELTGSLGDVMKESAKAAISYIRSYSDYLGVSNTFYKDKDIHIHVPEGAVPKDGPSAGVTITTALVSALTSSPAKADVAMTGEVTLTGRVLPIGGLREKSMAAYTNGMKTVLIPEDNKKDLEQVDKKVLENIEFIPISRVEKAIEYTLIRPKNEKSKKKIEPVTVEKGSGDSVWN
ncbi:MAG: endopeptidase La [Ruminococcaceae bacterium]|nr:endopeptidase La [Oscillospiraceae bacterium]